MHIQKCEHIHGVALEITIVCSLRTVVFYDRKYDPTQTANTHSGHQHNVNE